MKTSPWFRLFPTHHRSEGLSSDGLQRKGTSDQERFERDTRFQIGDNGQAMERTLADTQYVSCKLATEKAQKLNQPIEG